MTGRVLTLSLEGHPSSRLRIGQYVPRLRADGFSVEEVSLDSPKVPPSKLRRIATALRGADVVFVQRIASIPLNGLLRASRARVVYDVDDALHLVRPGQIPSTRSPGTLKERLVVGYRAVARGSRYYGSRKRAIAQITSFADVVIVGNAFLYDQLARRSRNALVLPTCVIADAKRVKTHAEGSPIRIGWIGLKDNLRELDALDPAFRALRARFGDDVRLSIVSSRPYETSAIGTEFVRWSLETETESVLRFDIGIMPLADNPFARGKCALKAIQCMSFGLPVVVSPVGMNIVAVDDGVDGFFARTCDEWRKRVSELVLDAALRARIGQHAFEKVQTAYSAEIGYQEVRRILASLTNAVPRGMAASAMKQ
jgi:glycosyltransferase involved in cell wall biosynthesis